MFYDTLIKQAPTEKEIIRSIRDDERKHNQILRDLYYNFTGWLNILNCALPPIGIIVILDFFMKRKKYKDNMDVGNFNGFNIVGVIVGAIVANILPWGIAAVNAMVVASVCYFIGYIRKKEA